MGAGSVSVRGSALTCSRNWEGVVSSACSTVTGAYVTCSSLSFRRLKVVSLRVFLRLFRHQELLAVGPLQPETIGLICGGVLCIFFRKYMTCVRVGLGG